MSELPRNWALIKLKEMAAMFSGYGFPLEYQGHKQGEVPFFKVADISNAVSHGNIFLASALNYISFEECEKLHAKPLKKGTIVFAKIGEAIKLLVVSNLLFGQKARKTKWMLLEERKAVSISIHEQRCYPVSLAKKWRHCSCSFLSRRSIHGVFAQAAILELCENFVRITGKR